MDKSILGDRQFGVESLDPAQVIGARHVDVVHCVVGELDSAAKLADDLLKLMQNSTDLIFGDIGRTVPSSYLHAVVLWLGYAL